MYNYGHGKREQEVVLAITGQYLKASGAAQQMFDVFGSRVPQMWQMPGPYENVGSCRYLDKPSSGDGLSGIAKDHIIELREERNTQVPGQNELTECPYHRMGSGCTLGELKSPICISHIDMPGEIERLTGVPGTSVWVGIRETLEEILVAQSVEDVAGNAPRVEAFVRYIEMLTARIASSPVIEQQ